MSQKVMKLVCLAVLTLQNVSLILVMRYARSRAGPMFLASTAVVLAEVMKLLICVGIVVKNERGIAGMVRSVYRSIAGNFGDFLRVCVPAGIYMVQNNLLYVALTNLEAGTFQITYQLKILTTALFSVLMLRKRLSIIQWFSLVLLFIGVAIVQLDSTPSTQNRSPIGQPSPVNSMIDSNTTSESQNTQATENILKSSPNQNHLLGLAVVILAAFTSGYAGIYFERLLKRSSQPLSIMNVHLCFIGIVFSMAGVYLNDGQVVKEKGFLYGYDSVVWVVVALNSFGGLMTALVVKYADNILKGFATSCAIILSCALSVLLFDFTLTITFSVGAFCVVLSVYMYARFQPVAVIVKSKDE